MYVATSKQMKAYDEALLKVGYSIEELVDKASNAILPHCKDYNNILFNSSKKCQVVLFWES